MKQTFEIKLTCQDGVADVNNTNSQAKFLHVAFFLVFKGIFRPFGAKCGILGASSSDKVSWMSLHK